MKFLFFIFVLIVNLYGLNFKVATYNVENFFDLHYDKTEYKEFRPYSKYWNQLAFQNKLHNISKTIKDLNTDILALQEIESKTVLKKIIKKNPKYKYSTFYKNNNSAIGLALLSTFPILKTKNIIVNKSDKYSRDILKCTLKVNNKSLVIYINHWRSKRAKESKRIPYALALKADIDTLSFNTDYIILGDLNSNYNEYQTFKYDKKLNNTHGITGINQILNTTINENFIRKESILKNKKKTHYNTWLELENQNRFSSKFKNINNTPDNIILSRSLFDSQNISYINNSFQVFKKTYLYKNNKIQRWNRYKKTGYSDHLPIYAYFSTSKQNYKFNNNYKRKIQKDNSINFLYETQKISNYKLKNVIVIYKSNKIAIIKHHSNNSKAIMIYKPPKTLKLGYSYNITVDEIDTYNGLKEIKKISHITQIKYHNDFKNFYLDGNTINLYNQKLINNIVTKLEGVYRKNYLYFNNSKIRLYFKKGIKKPEDGKRISITSGHLSIYKSFIQIVFYSNKDFEVN